MNAIATMLRLPRKSGSAVNIHHLELFYHVSRHGGISAAVRRMPYGIQQPAVSGQILRLEAELGTPLFVRKPFQLTPAGSELFTFIEPFFAGLPEIAARLRKHTQRNEPPLRIGSSELVLREHLPAVAQALKRSCPDMRLALRSGYQNELESWVRAGEIDLAIIPARGRTPPGLRRETLLCLPLALLVGRKSQWHSATEILTNTKHRESLIGLPEGETLDALFQTGLRRRGVKWPVSVEASSMDMVTRFVAEGQGVGVVAAFPGTRTDRRLRALPLDGFDPLEVSAIWQRKRQSRVQPLLDEIARYLSRTSASSTQSDT